MRLKLRRADSPGGTRVIVDAGHWHVVLLFIDVSFGVCLSEILQLNAHGSRSDCGFSRMSVHSLHLLLSFIALCESFGGEAS